MDTSWVMIITPQLGLPRPGSLQWDGATAMFIRFEWMNGNSCWICFPWKCMTNHTLCTCSTFTPGISYCHLLPIALQGVMYVSYQLVSEPQTTSNMMSCGFPAVPRDLPKSYRVVQFHEKVPQGSCWRFTESFATYFTKSSHLKWGNLWDCICEMFF